MKNFFKIFGITLGSVIGLLIIVISIAIWVVFTPSKLTPIARTQLSKMIKCESSLESADLTFFSTFPSFSVHIKNLSLVNPIAGAPSDTLASIEDFNATIDFKKWWREDAIVLNSFILTNTKANIFTDSLGVINYDIFRSSTPNEDDPEDTSSFSNPFSIIDLQTIRIVNLSASYIDVLSKTEGRLSGLDSKIVASLEGQNGDAKIALSVDQISYNKCDSSAIYALLNDVKMSVKGIKGGDTLSGEMNLSFPSTSLKMEGENYLISSQIAVLLPFNGSLSHKNITLTGASLLLNDFTVAVDGSIAQKGDGKIGMDMKLGCEDWDLRKLISIIPKSLAKSLKDYDAAGKVSLYALVTGDYGDGVFPQVDAEILLKRGVVKYAPIPFLFRGVDMDLFTKIDLNKGARSSAFVKRFSAKTGESSVSLSGNISDLLGRMYCDVKMGANLNLPELKPMLPDSMGIVLNGIANANLKGEFYLDELGTIDLTKIKVAGDINFDDFDVLYKDTISVKSPKISLSFTSYPNGKENIYLKPFSSGRKAPFKDVLRAKMDSDQLDAVVGRSISANLTDANFRIGIGDFSDTMSVTPIVCDFNIGELFGAMDTLLADIDSPVGSVMMIPSQKDKGKMAVKCDYNSRSLYAAMGSDMSIDTKAISINLSAIEKSGVNNGGQTQDSSNFITKWSPKISVDFNEGIFRKSGLDVDIDIPTINFDFNPEFISINNSRVIIDRSDFNLSGIITNLDKYLSKSGLLTANFEFISDYTDVTRLMDLVSGIGSSDVKTEDTIEVKSGNDSDPFIVPLGIDVTLNTKIKLADVNRGCIQNVGGKLIIKDGVVVLEEMGFTSKAARMQLTAMYKSPRRNHLFVGMDFHLLDVDIAELIYMIPQIDTIVPMLKSFGGAAQFHIAAETYLKSDYSLKMSTLRGAAALEAKDLVLMDSKTFEQISKLLMFKKKTENKVDSLSVEMTVFRNEVDLYPFLFSMDNYQAVIAGRHNLDMSFDYHISLVHCPLPVRLGLEVKGNFDDMKFKLVPCKYNNLFKPEKRNALQERTLELKKLISDSLKANVKEY